MNIFDLASSGGQSFDWLTSLVVVSLKGAVVVAAAGLLSVALRRGRAAVRHALWCVALCGLLVMPLLSYSLHGWQLAVLPPVEAGAQPAPADEQTAALGTALGGGVTDAVTRAGAQTPGAAVGGEGRGSALAWPAALLLFWLAGVLVFSCRLLVGLAYAGRIARGAERLDAEPWTSLTETLSGRLGLTRSVVIKQSGCAAMPLTCGVFSSVVLLPADAGRWSPERRLAVVLHELSHVKRRDVLTQILAQAVCALHWFNPLVWYAARQLRKEQEWACDERVVSSGVVAAPDYARHLLEVARESHAYGWAAPVTTAMARGSQFEERLRAILSPAPRRAHAARATVACVALVCSLLLPVSTVKLVHARGTALLRAGGGTTEPAQPAGSGSLTSRAQTATAGPSEPGEQPAPGRVVTTTEEGLHAAPGAPALDVAPAETGAASVAVNPAAQEPPPAPQRPEGEVTTATERSFTEEEKNHLMNNGVGSDYIREMEEAGYGGLTASQLVALYTNGVRADYVSELRRVGYDRLPAKELIALRTNGINTEVIRSYQAVEYANFKARNFISFRSNGVTPAYLKAMKALGYDRLTPKQIVDMWVADVTPEFIRRVRAAGGTDLSPERLIELRRAGGQ